MTWLFFLTSTHLPGAFHISHSFRLQFSLLQNKKFTVDNCEISILQVKVIWLRLTLWNYGIHRSISPSVQHVQ